MIGRSTTRRTATAVAGITALIAPLLSGCGTKASGPSSDKWEKISDYSFTLELFQGKCGELSHGAWSITVRADKVTEAKPLNSPARKSHWPEGVPTLKELYADAQKVRKDGAYDIARIHYDNGPYGRRPASFYTLMRGKYADEHCETYTDYQALDKAD